MSASEPQHAETWQLESDRTVYLRVPGGWLAFGEGATITDEEMVGTMRRLLDDDGRIATERLLGVHGLVTE